MLRVKYARMCDCEPLCFSGPLAHKVLSDIQAVEAEAVHGENIAIHAR